VKDREDAVWFLEGFHPQSGALQRTPMEEFPFMVGRRLGLDLTLPSPEISGHHAEIDLVGDAPVLRDLGSTNGTFVNRQRCAEASVHLKPGDVVHFAELEFRVGREIEHSDSTPLDGTVPLSRAELSRHFDGFGGELRTLIGERQIEVRYEPVILLSDLTVLGWEALSRGSSAELPAEPNTLFAIASEQGMAAELSRLCRVLAVEQASVLPAANPLFLNCHPDEVADTDRLLRSLDEVAPVVAGRPLVLEIHEASITSPKAIGILRDGLASRGFTFAYDDFGAGQARLAELAEVPPAYLKFDRQLISGLDQAQDSRKRLLVTLVEVAADLGVVTIAEGIEKASEAHACRTSGFTAGQGRHFGGVRHGE
jgi:EAL domain-containing protein (putative c-di-GMP-specific phosphodiesterase class I)